MSDQDGQESFKLDASPHQPRTMCNVQNWNRKRQSAMHSGACSGTGALVIYLNQSVSHHAIIDSSIWLDNKFGLKKRILNDTFHTLHILPPVLMERLMCWQLAFEILWVPWAYSLAAACCGYSLHTRSSVIKWFSYCRELFMRLRFRRVSDRCLIRTI